MQESALLHGSVSDTNDTGMINSVVALNSGNEAWRGGYKIGNAANLTFLRDYQRSMLSVILVNSKGAAFMSAMTV